MDLLAQVAAAMEEGEVATPTPPEYQRRLRWEGEDVRVPHPHNTVFGQRASAWLRCKGLRGVSSVLSH
eukprot:2614162-Prorocentrum_lima.AAC.1